MKRRCALTEFGLTPPPPRAARSRCLPRWVASDPRFPATVASLVSGAGVDDEPDAFLRLHGVAACIALAARRIEKERWAPTVAHEAEWQAHWLSAARSLCLRRDRRALDEALRRIPAHAHPFDIASLSLRSEAGFAGALQSLAQDRYSADRRHDLRTAGDDMAK